jgi:hypothetical protein
MALIKIFFFKSLLSCMIKGLGLVKCSYLEISHENSLNYNDPRQKLKFQSCFIIF